MSFIYVLLMIVVHSSLYGYRQESWKWTGFYH